MFRSIVSLFFCLLLTGVVATAEHDPVCIDWKLTAAAYKKNFAKWKANKPSCYSFTFQDVALEHRPTMKRIVKNGKGLIKKPYRALQTLDDFWNLIKTKCIQGCPTNGATYCLIEYTKDPESGVVYPSFVSIHPEWDSSETGDYTNYVIEDVCVKKCPQN